MLGAACLSAVRPGVLQQAERQSVLDVLHTLGSRAASPSAAEAAMVAAASIVNKAPAGEMQRGLHASPERCTCPLRTAVILDCIEQERGTGETRKREGGCIVVESHAECCSSPSMGFHSRPKAWKLSALQSMHTLLTAQWRSCSKLLAPGPGQEHPCRARLGLGQHGPGWRWPTCAVALPWLGRLRQPRPSWQGALGAWQLPVLHTGLQLREQGSRAQAWASPVSLSG